MKALLQDLGAMRLALLATVLITLPMAAFVDVEPEGFGIITAYIAPAVAVLLVFVLLLDALMSKVFSIDTPVADRGPARCRIRAALLGVLLIVIFWGPFYYSLLEP